MPRIVAIDFGTANIKATVWNVAGRKSSFADRWIMPVPQSGSTEGLLERQMIAVKAMLDEHPEATASSTVVGAVFGGPALNITKVDLPFTDKKQVQTTLPFAVEEAVPFELETRILAWRTLRSELTTQTLVALADEEPLGALLEALREAKVDPRRVFADQEVLGRWVPATLPEDTEADSDPLDIAAEPALPMVAVLDLGHSQSIVTIFHGTELLAGRTLDIGGADLTAQIAEHLNCSWHNAERLKCGLPPEPDVAPISIQAQDDSEPSDEEDTDPGIDQPSLTPYDQLPPPGIENLPPELRSDLDALINRLLAEVRATLIGLEDRLGGEIKQVVLGGGNARLPGLARQLQDDLSVPVTWAIGTGDAAVPCEYLLSDAAAEVLAGAIPLSLVDLRTGPFKWRSGFDAMQAVSTYGLALVMFFTLALGGLYAWQSFSLSGQITEIQSRIDRTIQEALGDERTRNTTEAMVSMRRRIDDAEARAASLSQKDQPPTIHMVYRLSTALPPPSEANIDVDVLTMTPAVLKFDAEVESYAAAEQIEVALRKIKQFGQCTKSNEQQRRGKVSFTMTCPLTDTAPEEG